MTLGIITLCHYAKCHYDECGVLHTFMLSVVILSVVMLSVVMLSVVMLSVVMPSFVAPFSPLWPGNTIAGKKLKSFLGRVFNSKLGRTGTGTVLEVHAVYTTSSRVEISAQV